MRHHEQGGHAADAIGEQVSIHMRDLIDFYHQWPHLKNIAERIRDRKDLREDEKEVVEWLIVLADRVCEQDLT